MFIYKTTYANHVRISNGPDHEPNASDHPNSECVWNSSPHCTNSSINYVMQRRRLEAPGVTAGNNYKTIAWSSIFFFFNVATRHGRSLFSPLDLTDALDCSTTMDPPKQCYFGSWKLQMSGFEIQK